MATIYEVSKLAGVSLATVSRVINGSSSVSPKTLKKVQLAMEQLNYQPNAVAKSLASSRSDCIGVLVSELKSAFFTDMMGAIEQEFRKYNKHIVVTASHSDAGNERDDIKFLISRNCDALIVHVEALSDDYIIELCRGPVPIVVVNRYIPEIEQHCIFLNNELGGYLATKAAIDNGHRDIVYVSGPNRKNDAMERLEGHKRALAEAGIKFDPSRLFEGNYLQHGGWNGFMHFHEAHIPFSAIICGNDEMATGAMAAAREVNLDLPSDISVIGFDNMNFAKYTYPKLTSIDNPIGDMGRMAARIIMQRVYKTEGQDIQHQFLPEVITRDSLISR